MSQIDIDSVAGAGTSGPQGFPGIDGVDGLDGQDGLPGAIGPQGPQGVQGIPGSSGSSDPTSSSYVSDEFHSGANPGSSVPSSGLNAMGQLGWYMTSGNGPSGQKSSELNHPGILTFGMNNGRNALHLKESGADLLPASTFDATWWVRPNNVDANTEYIIGWVNGANDVGSQTNAIALVKAYANTNWHYLTRAASVGTSVDTGVAITTGWFKIRIRRVDATTIGFTINNGTELTTTSNIPTAAIYTTAEVNVNTAANKSLDLDFFGLAVTGFSR